jgi:hypothetical protein
MSSFIDCPGSLYSYFITWVNLDNEWDQSQKYLVVELVVGFSVVLLGSRASTWREPGTGLRAAISLLYFARLLSFPTLFPTAFLVGAKPPGGVS